MKPAILIVTLIQLFVTGNSVVQGKTKQSKIVSKPANILFILTDDQTFRTIHALGNNEIHTPAMDRLVNSGVTFTHSFYMGALGGAVCMPSRAMLLTGKNMFSLHQDGKYIPGNDITMPEHFRKNGYQTFGTGKWHQDKESFNRSFSHGDNIFFGGMHSYETNGHFAPLVNHYDVTGKYEQPFVSEKFSSDCFADAAIGFIQSVEQEKPFFIYVAFTSPHDPRTPPEEFAKQYKGDDITTPPSFMPIHPFDNGALNIRAESLIASPRKESDVKSEMAKYYGMISEVDQQIQRIINALNESGKLENTYIVFTSDNGLAIGQHGLMAKQNQYDHSVRVPLILCGPDIPSNEKRHAYVYVHDLFPTLCELTGLTIPESVESKSFKNVIFHPGKNHRKTIFTCYSDKQRAVRKNEIKLIVYNIKGTNKTQLFNLSEDPWELYDISEVPEYLPVKNQLSKILKKEMIQKNDFCDPEKPSWGFPVNLTWEELLQINP